MIRRIVLASVAFLGVALLIGTTLFFWRYRISDVMEIAIGEVSTAEYPEDPANRSVHYDRYQGRHLQLRRIDDDHYDFIFEPDQPGIARIALRNIDVSLFAPIKPTWIVDDRDLEVITYVEREWNRQQVRFPRHSSHLEIEGGDGFEKRNLSSVQLARNCLNAGLWEILFTTQEGGEERLYYHGWFDFPLGIYQQLFEEHNGSSYWADWFRLEHWVDPEGRRVDLTQLRRVLSESVIPIVDDLTGPILAEGEQKRKLRTLNATNFRRWEDFVRERNEVEYATFEKPGRYNVHQPWGNEYERFETLEKALHRKVRSPSDGAELDEIELQWRGDDGELSRFLISGILLDQIPQLPEEQYPKGLYLPMGISVPPVLQSYEDLEAHPPFQSPYFSVLLDETGRWLNHHRIAVDGVALRKDPADSRKLHLYLISYERHSLIRHFVLTLSGI